MLSINTHPAWDTCLLTADGYSSHTKLGPQEVSRRFKARICGKRAGQRGPGWLSELSERCLKDDTHVLGMAHVCHWLFVGVNLEAHQGSSVTEHKHTVQSNLGSVRLWFMTDPVRAGWRDLSPAEACKSGLFSLVNICEIWGEGERSIITKIIYLIWVHIYLLLSNVWGSFNYWEKEATWWRQVCLCATQTVDSVILFQCGQKRRRLISDYWMYLNLDWQL